MANSSSGDWDCNILTSRTNNVNISHSVCVIQVIPPILDLDVKFKKTYGVITPLGDTSMTTDLHACGCSLLLKYIGTSLSYSREQAIEVRKQSVLL